MQNKIRYKGFWLIKEYTLPTITVGDVYLFDQSIENFRKFLPKPLRKLKTEHLRRVLLRCLYGEKEISTSEGERYPFMWFIVRYARFFHVLPTDVFDMPYGVFLESLNEMDNKKRIDLQRTWRQSDYEMANKNLSVLMSGVK